MINFLRRVTSDKWFYRMFNTLFLAINVFDVIDEWGTNGWGFWLAVVLSVLFFFLALMSWLMPEVWEENRT